jgi:hypothetical protein
MQMYGWVVKDGEFKPPLPKEPPPGAPAGPRAMADSPIKILSDTAIGRKRSREEMETDVEEGEVEMDLD